MCIDVYTEITGILGGNHFHRILKGNGGVGKTLEPGTDRGGFVMCGGGCYPGPAVCAFDWLPGLAGLAS